MKKKIVLASRSPRRVELLNGIGLKFEVDPPVNYEEIHSTNRSAHEIVLINAIGKAESVASSYEAKSADELFIESTKKSIQKGACEGGCEGAIILGVDTIGAFEDHILEKPKDEADAFRMLKMLEGTTHEVLSGLCLIDTLTKRKVTAVESTRIEFVPMSDEEIKKYIKSGEPMDKAAAYAAQGIGSIFVKSMDGDYFNVVGLPMYRLNLMLKEFDISLIDIVN